MTAATLDPGKGAVGLGSVPDTPDRTPFRVQGEVGGE